MMNILIARMLLREDVLSEQERDWALIALAREYLGPSVVYNRFMEDPEVDTEFQNYLRALATARLPALITSGHYKQAFRKELPVMQQVLERLKEEVDVA